MKQVHNLNKQIKELKEEVKGYSESVSDYYDYATPLDIESVVEELKEKITCLESDSMNEVSQVEFDEMVEEKDEEIKELKLKLEASREVSTCYAKVVSQSPERKVEELFKNIQISPESAKKVASMIPDEKINGYSCYDDEDVM